MDFVIGSGEPGVRRIAEAEFSRPAAREVQKWGVKFYAVDPSV